MVELGNGPQGALVQLLYSPAGGPVLAEAAAQGLVQAIVQLPGGGYAMYYPNSGLYYYSHSDWLGSVRMASKTDRTPVPTMAYAPFGEGYAGVFFNDTTTTE